MKKVLFVATVVKHHFMSFHIPYIKWFKENGYETHVCAKNDYDNKEDCVIPYCDKYYDLPFGRSPFDSNNIVAYKQLKKIIDSNEYNIIHCHTPVGGVLTRVAAIEARKNGTKVIYTAHGFHFYKGASIRNWLLYYPVEKWMAKYTDCLITTNNEDYKRVKNRFKAKSIKLINGVGVDLNEFKPQIHKMKSELRKEYAYNRNDFILFFAGELTYRKHQDLLIDAIGLLKDKIPNIKLLLAGVGDLSEKYQAQVNRLKIRENVHFIGYRKDIANIMALSDIAVSSSRQEGLPVNVMMAMAIGLPLVVTGCRGNSDLVNDGENGYVVGLEDIDEFVIAVEKLYASEELRNKFSQNNLVSINKYSLGNIRKKMGEIYKEYEK